jgi:hypothetical protein
MALHGAALEFQDAPRIVSQDALRLRLGCAQVTGGGDAAAHGYQRMCPPGISGVGEGVRLGGRVRLG